MSTIEVGSAVYPIEASTVTPVWADIMTDIRMAGGVVRISFAAIVGEGDAVPSATVTARLRFNTATAIDFRNALDNLLKGQIEAKTKGN